MKDTPDTLTHEQNQPALFAHLGKTHAMMSDLGLDRAFASLIELRASQINQCAYCVEMHLAEARQIGIPQDKLDMLIVWRETDLFSPAERALLAWTEELTVLDSGADLAQLRADLREHFSEKGISVVTADIGMINLWNRVQRSKH